ncbi:MAG: type II toxin-antitoxin system VapC family toxin [Armatimonadota bacterium]|nr:type II toxin-antitoxin system VapC family toxin [Armatimonadota bacterium]
MIILDTYTWVWWVDGNAQLPEIQRQTIEQHQSTGLGVCATSCWEVAKLVELRRLDFAVPVNEWLNKALMHPGVRLLPLSPRVAVESTQLPDSFHRDPADQIIVATARVYRNARKAPGFSHGCDTMSHD